jgi:anaerobic selenocysteine-containing dehydrogenase/Fe-S-cluster-containing dehydrogenase component
MALDRRDFLKSLGLVGATSLAGCSGAPLQNLYSYLTPDESLVPGLAYWYATVCRACPAGCGILVRTREGRPVKLEGNPGHPVNRGSLCARGQAFVQGLYGRDRVTRPLVRRDGQLVEAGWEEALKLVVEKLESARKVGYLGGLESGAFEDLLYDFLASFPETEKVIYEPLAPVSMANASAMLFFRQEIPDIDLEGVDYLVSVGADLLDAWLSPVQFSRQWAEGHGFQAGRRMRMEYAGPRRNLTANSADRWHPIPPDGGVDLLHAIAAGLFKLKRQGMQPSEVRAVESVLERFTESAAAPIAVERIVDRLAAAERGLVLFGGADVLTADATRGQMLAMIINIMTGAAGSALRYGENSAWSKASGSHHAIGLLESESDALVIYNADPVATLPGAAGAEKKLLDAPFVLALAWERNATTDAADVVLPVHHPLESWGDYEVNERVVGLMQPVRQPLHDSRHVGDLMIELATALGNRPRHAEYKRYVVARRAAGRAFDSSGQGDWEEALVRGGEFLPVSEPARLSFSPSAAAELPAATEKPAGSGPLLITPVSASLYDGRSAKRDWLLEVPDSLTQTAWEIPLEIPPGLAGEQGIEDGDLIKMIAGNGELTAKAYVNSGLVEGTVALRLGGEVMSLLDTTSDPGSRELARVQTHVTLEKIGRGALVSTSGGARSEGRHLYLSVADEQAQTGHFPQMTRHGEEHPDEHGHFHGAPLPMPHDEIAIEGSRDEGTITKLQEHPQHRWGLVVDLDLCTGCGACSVACYAENNIPIVGSEEVGRGRELSWIRLEKHVFGEGPDERWRFLPVMCQQCDNAPCETVCPVFASYHTADGLNAQVYNRCVGTRYCSNNCPYKVRRFNWFDYEREKPANQQLNPDVTVRSRGVMEKCTFCVQRIREVTNRAKAEKRPVRDGEIQPACVQTCPTGALQFGDFKQQEWAMSRLARDPRGYRLLDFHANTRPGVVYLRKVDSDPEKV